MIVFWAIAAIFFVVLELMTVALVSIWFVLGAVSALAAAILGGGVLLQWVLFFGVSILGLVLLRNFWTKRFNRDIEATNIDRYIGKTAVVTEPIDNLAAAGRVQISGQSWAARLDCEKGETVPKDAQVRVVRFEGAKAIVAPIASAAEENKENCM